MYIAVCDDNAEYINTVTSYIDNMDPAGRLFDYDTYNSGEKLLEEYKNGKKRYDILFLDMEMNGIDGIETANTIRTYDKKCIIVFITNHSHYALKSFECHPFDFILKPLDFDKFKKIMDAIQAYLPNANATLVFRQNKKTVRILYDDILYFENKSHWIYIYTKDREYRIYMGFNDLLKKINSDVFVVIHKSYIVNLNHIRSIGTTELTLDTDNISLPISRSNKNKVKELFTDYMERKYLE